MLCKIFHCLLNLFQLKKKATSSSNFKEEEIYNKKINGIFIIIPPSMMYVPKEPPTKLSGHHVCGAATIFRVFKGIEAPQIVYC